MTRLNIGCDERPTKKGWAPGPYMATCVACGNKFLGDKRAYTCADCAYGTDMNEQKDNAALYFAYDVNDTLHRYMEPSAKKMRADKGTSKAEVHAACKTLMQAMENGTEGEAYAVAVHAASIIGTYAINHGDRNEAYKKGGDNVG